MPSFQSRKISEELHLSPLHVFTCICVLPPSPLLTFHIHVCSRVGKKKKKTPDVCQGVGISKTGKYKIKSIPGLLFIPSKYS